MTLCQKKKGTTTEVHHQEQEQRHRVLASYRLRFSASDGCAQTILPIRVVGRKKTAEWNRNYLYGSRTDFSVYVSLMECCKQDQLSGREMICASKLECEEI